MGVRRFLVVVGVAGTTLLGGCSGGAPVGTAGPPLSSPAGGARSPAAGGAPSAPGGAPSVAVAPSIPSIPAGPVGAVTIKPGPDLCALLTAADIGAAGVQGAGPVAKNVLEAPTNFFCVYAGKSSATGGIELDASIIDPAQGDQVTNTVPPFGSKDVTSQVPGAEKALLYVPTPPTTEPAQIGVQAGTLLIGLGVPATDGAKAALIRLAALIVARAAAASSGALTLPNQPVLTTDACGWITGADLTAITPAPLTVADPTLSGGINFNDTSVQGLYLGKQVTCLYRAASGGRGLEVAIVDSPGDTVLMKKIWDEQIAFYANWAASGGSQKAEVAQLPGIGDAAQRIRFSDRSDGHFQNWIVEAVKGEVFVRLVTGESVEEGSGTAAVQLAGRILDRAAAFMAQT